MSLMAKLMIGTNRATKFIFNPISKLKNYNLKNLYTPAASQRTSKEEGEKFFYSNMARMLGEHEEDKLKSTSTSLPLLGKYFPASTLLQLI